MVVKITPKLIISVLISLVCVIGIVLLAARPIRREILSLPFVPKQESISQRQIRLKRSPTDGSGQHLILSLPNPYTRKINPASYLDKHVTDGSKFPTSHGTAEKLLANLYNNIPDKFYSRQKQTLSFVPDKQLLTDTILLHGEAILKGNPKIEKLNNQPYIDSIKAVESGKYEKALEFLQSNNNPDVLRQLDTGGEAGALKYLQDLGEANVKQKLDGHIDNFVIFEIKDKIVLSQSVTGPNVLIERIDGKQTPPGTSSGSAGNRPPNVDDIKGWDFTQSNNDVEIILYAKVSPKDGQPLSSVTEADITEWKVHFNTDPDAPAPVNPPTKLFTDETQPRFLLIDQIDAKKKRVIIQQQNFDQQFKQRYAELQQRNQDLVSIQNELIRKQTELEPIADFFKQNAIKDDDLKAATKAKQDKAKEFGRKEKEIGELKKRNEPPDVIAKAKTDLENLKNEITEKGNVVKGLEEKKKKLSEAFENTPEVKSKRTQLDLLQAEIKDLQRKDFNIDVDPELLAAKRKHIKNQEAVLSEWKNVLNDEIALTNDHFTTKPKDFDKNTDNLRTVYDDELRNLKIESSILDSLDDYSAAHKSGNKEKMQQIEAEIEAKRKTLKKDLAKKIVDSRGAVGKMMDTLRSLSLSCKGGGGGGRRRRSIACLKGVFDKKLSPVPPSPEKIKRTAEKKGRFKKFFSNIFSSEKNKKSVEFKNLKLEDSTKGPGIKVKLKDRKFVKDLLGITEINEVYMGKKTMQKTLSPFKGKLAKISKQIDKANYAFLIRDFTKAAITGDKTTMAIMGTMTGVQVVASGLGKLAKSGTFALKTAKGLMVASRVASGALMGIGFAFDIYSLVNSGQCLATKSENKALCRARDPKCEIENDVCGGRDSVADIVITSISMIGGVVSLAFPVAAPFIAIFSFLLMIFSEVYQANVFLDNFEKDIPLTSEERGRELGRRLIAMNVSDYLEHLREQKRVNTRALENILDFLTANKDTFWAYFAPGLDRHGNQLQDNIVRVREEDWDHRNYHRWSPDPNRLVEGSKISTIDDFNYFCRPVSDSRVKDVGFLQGYGYYCKDAVGLRVQTSKNVKGLYALFKMEQGRDEVIGFEVLPNYFEVRAGQKSFTGGSVNDIFVIEEGFTGSLDGSGGDNSMQLADNLTGINVAVNSYSISVDSYRAQLENIQSFQGRRNKSETFGASCTTSRIDGMGGPLDEILIGDVSCSSPMEMRIEIKPITQLTNQYTKNGTFFYSISDGVPDSPENSSLLSILKADALTVHHFFSGNDMKLEVINKKCEDAGKGVNALTFHGKSKTVVTLGTNCASDFSVSVQTEKGGYLNLQKSESSIYAYPNCTARDVEISLSNNKMEVECDGLNLFVYDPSVADLPGIFTTDGGEITLVPTGNNVGGFKYSPIIYFQLNSQMNTVRERASGSLKIRNVFNIDSGNWIGVEGGWKDDEFLVDLKSKIGTLVGNGGEDSIEIKEGSSSAPVQVNLPNHYIRSGQNTVTLDGAFVQITGRSMGKEVLTTECFTRYVNLRGSNDEIIIPSFQCPNDVETQFQIHPGTTVDNRFKERARFLYSIIGEVGSGRSASQLQFNTSGNSTMNFVLLPLPAAQLNVVLLDNPTSSTLLITNPRGTLNVSISFSFYNLPMVSTEDGGVITFRQETKPTGTEAPTYSPMIYFELNANSKYKEGNITGNPTLPNVFKISSSFNSIRSESQDNNFIFGGEGEVDSISVPMANPNRNEPNTESSRSMQILEIEDSFQRSTTIDLVSKHLHLGAHSAEINGNFGYVFGRYQKVDTLIPDCHVRVVDLRSGISDVGVDLIEIGRSLGSEQPCLFNITITVGGFTKIENNGGVGRFVYLVPSTMSTQTNAGRSNKATVNITLPQGLNPQPSEHFISVDYPAVDLVLNSSSPFRISLRSLSTNQQLDVGACFENMENGWNHVRISNADSSEVLLDKRGEAAFKFQLGYNGKDETILGGKWNPNYFVIGGSFKVIQGGTKNDMFLIGGGASIEELHGGGGGEETLQIHDSNQGSVTLELTHNFVFFEETLKSLRFSGNFAHFVGREGEQEIVTVAPNTRTVDILGSTVANGKDMVFIPDLEDGGFYNLLIRAKSADQFLIVNGLDRETKQKSKLVYQVSDFEGHFMVYTMQEIDDETGDESEQLDNDLPDSASVVGGEIWSIPSTLFQLIEIGVNLDENILTISHQPERDDSLNDEHERYKISLQTKLFGSYENLKNQLLTEGDFGAFELSDPNVSTQPFKVSNFTEFTVTPNSTFPTGEEDLDEDDADTIPAPPTFPSIITLDNYLLKINHLGGIHATSTYSVDFPTEAAILEIIEEHVEVVNNLGISLILSLTESQNEEPTALVIFGGDDEVDALMNHRDLPTHLVSSSGGATNYFMLFPTIRQAPVYIYMYDAPESESVDSPIPLPRSWILNLASFFETTEYLVPENHDPQESNSSLADIPNIILPTLSKYGDNDLLLVVKYLVPHVGTIDPPSEEENYSEQNVIIVNGVSDYWRIEIVLYSAPYRIVRNYNPTTANWEWKMEVIPFRLNPIPPDPVRNQDSSASRMKRSIGDQDDGENEPTTRYVFLSTEDLLEYTHSGAPVELTSQDLKMREKSVYRNGNDVIVTNKVDPNPGFEFDLSGLWSSGNDPNSYISMVLIDMKEAMEVEGFSILLELEPNTIVGPGETDKFLSINSFEKIKVYEEAVTEMMENQKSNTNLLFAICALLLLGILTLSFTVLYIFISKLRRRKSYSVQKKLKEKANGVKVIGSYTIIGEKTFEYSVPEEDSDFEVEDLSVYMDTNYSEYS